MAFNFDIFCTVVDNFGDIGVTWRLARQLHDEGHGPVRLWVDDLASFSRICPTIDPAQESQSAGGITIQHWHADADLAPARVVIEAFACELPAPYKARMQHMAPPPAWLNLEYLSAEEWVEGCHALSSPQGRLNKHFFFPGFTDKTGGLLCERDLMAQRQAWQSDKDCLADYWESLGLPPPGRDELRISLFAYESEAIPSLIEAWRQGPAPITLLVPVGRALPQVLATLGVESAHPGDRFDDGALTVVVLPMTDQVGYDRLLWSCDLNIVRGEDSFVRAQWAARPFLWHIYPQEEEYHLVKLEAFLDRYLASHPQSRATWIRGLMLALNRGEPCQALWQGWDAQCNGWQEEASLWPDRLLTGGDLVTRLVKFLETKI
ncbi:elongation factor P maturation arginine rhamnosyltransferase EarP [Aeromonas schubertii]|uniref:Protein-arginine rhamnosyltransferase n=1 Tax=Aeromonas schubertii TaxID=652 RepID=A0A0S2SMQ3_9GAMM|nr:elongation factor P maturation arginine rhamnosyltransferase EarP [Aeromonas schubertii]ALP42985.1 hypothetical protein WL1483_3566 [Aeromonas schubertii]